MDTGRDAGDAYEAADFTAGKPDYTGGGIVNLMASLLAACGVEPRYAALDLLPPADLAPARHLVLIVADGLGQDLLSSASAAPALTARLRGSLSSVFPPTTAAAVTTFLTGLAPQQHGLTGWFMFMRELGSVVSVLPFETRLGSTPLGRMGLTPGRLFGNRSIFGALPRACFCVSPRAIAFSQFNRAHAEGARIVPYETVSGLFRAIEESVKRSRRPTFTYAYWPRLDQVAHERGFAHPQVRAHLGRFDEGFAQFLRRMRGTEAAVILTADHGFVDATAGGTVRLAEHPPLERALLLPLCGEPRAAYCYVQPRRARDFPALVADRLADRAHCVPSEQLLEEGWFGPGSSHPELAARIGQYTLIMRSGCAIMDALPGEERARVVGVHGGVSAAEQRVPLVLARC